MALLLPRRAVGLVVKMELWHKCSTDTPALGTTESTLLATKQSQLQDADPEGKYLRSEK